MTPTADVIAGLLSGSVLSVLINWWVNRAKPEVDRGELKLAREKQAAETYSGLISALRTDVDTVRVQVRELRAQVDELSHKLAVATDENARLRRERNDARDFARACAMILTAADLPLPLEKPGWID